jgi:hypothetical protein
MEMQSAVREQAKITVVVFAEGSVHGGAERADALRGRTRRRDGNGALGRGAKGSGASCTRRDSRGRRGARQGARPETCGDLASGRDRAANPAWRPIRGCGSRRSTRGPCDRSRSVRVETVHARSAAHSNDVR